MVKLPPMIGSCIVACAFTRHVFFGSCEGKKTVKPRLASTSDQSEIVLGVPETTGTVAVGVLPTVVVAVVPGVAVAAVAVTPGAELAVAVGFPPAPSSLKSMVRTLLR